MQLFAGVLVLALLSIVDLQRAHPDTIVIYTTPALRDLLERDVIPRYQATTGLSVLPIYVSAGEEFNRLRMSGIYPEVDIFLHASPLFIEKGYSEGLFEAYTVAGSPSTSPWFQSRNVSGGHLWYSFAWSPLVEVYRPDLAAAPDLLTTDLRFGLAHPLLSNNGIYNVVFFETVSPEAGARAISLTVVQPVNARATILGIADLSFDVTLGYEAVTQLFVDQGARVSFDFPLLNGTRWTLPVALSVGLVKGHPHPAAMSFVDFLFTPGTQSRLGGFYLNDTLRVTNATLPGVPPGVRIVQFDWSTWQSLEAALPRYEVT